MRKLTCALTALLLAIILSGCNTVNGIGEDIQSGGKALSKASGK